MPIDQHRIGDKLRIRVWRDGVEVVEYSYVYLSPKESDLYDRAASGSIDLSEANEIIRNLIIKIRNMRWDEAVRSCR